MSALTKIFFFNLLLLWVHSAYAAMLFIDVNNSFEEIQTVRQQRKKMGEPEPIIVPEFDLNTAKKLAALKKESKAAWDAYGKLNCSGQVLCSGAFTNPACTAARDKGNAIEDKRVALTKDRLSPEKISSAIRAAYDKGQKITSVMVSGEDGGSVFGAYGTLKYDELAETFGKVPELKNDVESLYLWGCYMGTSGRVVYDWKKMFPKSKLIVGFHDSGPADGSPPSLDLLRKTIAAEKSDFRSYDETMVKKFVNGIAVARQMNTSMTINDCYMDRNTLFSLPEMEEIGKQCVKKFPRDLHQKYLCFQNGAEGCGNLPTDHQAGQLRDYYSFLRTNEYCLNNPGFYKEIPDAPNPDNVLRLVYFDRIWDNFLRNYGADMARLNTLIKAVGEPDEMQFPANPKLSRGEFLAWYDKVRKAISERGNEPKAKYINGMIDKIYFGLVSLNPWYTPNSWIQGPSSEKG
ncbi:MAG: hypothetical protein ACXWQO_15025, partial [Bdellovibrionota bacterium]